MSKLQTWPISLPPQGNNNNVNNVVLFHNNNNVESSLIIPPPMGELRSPSPNLPYVSSSSSDPDTPNSSSSSTSTPPAPPLPSHTLVQPTRKNKHRHKARVFRAFRSVICSFPTASCKFPTLPIDGAASYHRSSFPGGAKVTGTLFGYRKGRVSLSFQETSKSLPSVVIELAIQTSALQREMSAGMVRIALECEKRPEKEKVKLLQEPLWSMFCNGKKTGFGVRREPTEDDLAVMELLKAVSMGVGVLPIGGTNSDVDGNDGDLAYFRAQFEHMVGSKDSETFYMLSPEANAEPELTVFFVRL